MGALQRFHGACLIAVAVGFALFRMVLGLLLIAGCSWLIHKGFTSPGAIALLGVLIIVGVIFIIGALGPLVGPPIPSVKSSTRLETRRALRRAGLLRRR
jgi:hypothetical protein